MKIRKTIAEIVKKCFIENQALTEDIFKENNAIKKYEKLMINAVVSFLKKEWGFDANIIVKKKPNDSLIGDISLNHNSVKNNKFTLHFNPNQTYVGVIKSLIHELTHVK
jgi:ethanolamine ammonia-lyase large subunit